MEAFNLETILYWHWILLGIALIISEIFLMSFFILWFGASAVLVGLLVLVFPDISLTWQVLIWTLLSSVLAWAWFKYLKPLSIDRTTAGLSAEAIQGEIAQVISVPSGKKRGKLRFPAPILGADEWLFITQDSVIIGDRIQVTGISGNCLIVQKHQSQH